MCILWQRKQNFWAFSGSELLTTDGMCVWACVCVWEQDLGSLGVPYLSVDVGGNMCLMKPDLEVKSLEDEGKAIQQVRFFFPWGGDSRPLRQMLSSRTQQDPECVLPR